MQLGIGGKGGWGGCCAADSGMHTRVRAAVCRAQQRQRWRVPRCQSIPGLWLCSCVADGRGEPDLRRSLSLRSICIHPQQCKTHTHTLIQSLRLLLLQSDRGSSGAPTFNPVGFWRNSSQREIAAVAAGAGGRAGGQEARVRVPEPAPAHASCTLRTFIQLISLAVIAFNWSHSGPLSWPSADERAHSPLHYTASSQGFLTGILGEDS